MWFATNFQSIRNNEYRFNGFENTITHIGLTRNIETKNNLNVIFNGVSGWLKDDNEGIDNKGKRRTERMTREPDTLAQIASLATLLRL